VKKKFEGAKEVFCIVGTLFALFYCFIRLMAAAMK